MDRNLANELKRLRDERQKKFNEEDWEGALQTHDQILQLSPSALRYANRGSILYRLGRLQEAVESYRKALEMDGSLKRARADLERLEAQLHQEKKGIKAPAKGYEKGPEITAEDRDADVGESQLDYIADDEKQSKVTKLRDERQKALQAQDFDKALKYHDQILDLEPTALRHANRGSILYRMGKIREAIASYKKALEMDPSQERARLDLGKLESLAEEEHLMAEPKAQKDGNQGQLDELRKKRQEKINAGEWESALGIHDELLKFEPTALRYANRGALLYRLGRFQEARESYRKALELDPRLDKAKEDMANLDAQMEEEILLPGSKKADMSPEQRVEKIEELRKARQKHLDAKEWQKALDLHDELTQLDPTPLRYVNRGSIYYRMGSLEQAIESYRIALEMDPNLGRAKSDLVRLEEELAKQKVQKKTEEAKKTEEKQKEDVNAKLEELKQKRQEMIESENWEQALVFQDQLIELEPESAMRYVSRGSILYRLGRIAEAIRSYGRALDLDKTLDRARVDLDRIKDAEMDRLRQIRQDRMEKEDWEGALEIHDLILVLDPIALRHANRGSILYRMKRLKDAADSYRKALEMDPTLENAREDLLKIEKELKDAPVIALPAEFEEDEEEVFGEIPAGAIEEEVVPAKAKEEPGTVEKKVMSCVATLSGHEAEILHLQLTPDEQLLVSASKDHSIRIWDVNDHKCLQTLKGHQDWVRALSITNNGEKIISASDDWSIKVWDIRTGKCEHTFTGHTMPAIATCVSKNDRFVLTGSRDRTIRIWDLKSGKQTNTLQGHEDWVNCIAIAPEGNKAVSGSYDRSIRIWNVLGWRCTNTLQGHEGWIEKLLITSDGKYIISASRDRTIRIWNSSGEEPAVVLAGHTGQITDVAITADGKQAVSTGSDSCVYLWEIPSGKNKAKLTGDSTPFDRVAICPEKQMVVAAGSDGKMWVWTTKDEPKVVANWTEPAPVSTFASLSKDKALISGDRQGTIKIWKIE